jgi:hypothetical protein
METRSLREDRYDQYSYAGLVNRIRDGVTLTTHQLEVMKKCGLTTEDFRNQRTEQEKIDLLNRIRRESDRVAPSVDR